MSWISQLFGFLFGAAVLSGLVIGGSVLWILWYFKKYGMSLVWHPIKHRKEWVDIVLSTILLVVGLTHPSLCIPLAVAAISISVAIKVVAWMDRRKANGADDRVSRVWMATRTYLGELKQALVDGFNEGRESHPEG